MKKVLTIAGSDCSGGAGIQADLKTMLANGVYGMSIITSLTAQNTTGVRSIQNATGDFLKDQIDSVFEDIVPDAVKTGMIPSKELVEVIAERMKFYNVISQSRTNRRRNEPCESAYAKSPLGTYRRFRTVEQYYAPCPYRIIVLTCGMTVCYK